MRPTQSIFGDPGAIAPSVDKTWRDDFILELRLLSVPGARIGDALMTVETHVAESGEPAQEVFGEARGYAREIAAATGDAGRGWRVGPATVVGTLLGLLGMLVLAQAFPAWLDGERVAVTVGQLVGLGVLLALASALFFTATLRLVVERPVLVMFLPALLIGVLVGVFLLLREPLFTTPTGPTAAVGAVLLLVGSLVGWFDGPAQDDRISAPGRPSAPTSGSRLASVLAMPVMTLVLLLLLWVLHVVVGALS